MLNINHNAEIFKKKIFHLNALFSFIPPKKVYLMKHVCNMNTYNKQLTFKKSLSVLRTSKTVQANFTLHSF